jgi:hypothetical protein
MKRAVVEFLRGVAERLRQRDVLTRTTGLGVSASLHALLFAIPLILVTGRGAEETEGPPSPEVVLAPPEDDEFPGLKAVDEPTDVPAFNREYPNVTVQDVTFDVSRIASRAHVLFPFITPGLSMELFTDAPKDEFERLLRSPLLWGVETKATQPERPLKMSVEAIQALIDKSWAPTRQVGRGSTAAGAAGQA